MREHYKSLKREKDLLKKFKTIVGEFAYSRPDDLLT